jgi:hypothetical protein
MPSVIIAQFDERASFKKEFLRPKQVETSGSDL